MVLNNKKLKCISALLVGIEFAMTTVTQALFSSFPKDMPKTFQGMVYFKTTMEVYKGPLSKEQQGYLTQLWNYGKKIFGYGGQTVQDNYRSAGLTLHLKPTLKSPYYQIHWLNEDGSIITSSSGKLDFKYHKDVDEVQIKLYDPKIKTRLAMAIIGKKSDMTKGFTFLADQAGGALNKILPSPDELFAVGGAYKIIMEARPKAFTKEEVKDRMTKYE